MPNDVLYSSQMINYTYSGTRRIEVPIGVSYDNTPEQVRAAALDAISTLEGTLADPAPAVYLDSYGDSSINYLVQVWVPATNYLSMRYALNERIYDAFQRHGVEITYPHLNIHNIPAPKASGSYTITNAVGRVKGTYMRYCVPAALPKNSKKASGGFPGRCACAPAVL